MNRFTATALVFAILAPPTVWAQQAPTTPEVYTLTVTSQEVQILGQALGEMPYKTSQPVIQKLNDQITKQVGDRNKADGLKEVPPASPPNTEKP